MLSSENLVTFMPLVFFEFIETPGIPVTSAPLVVAEALVCFKISSNSCSLGFLWINNSFLVSYSFRGIAQCSESL